MISSFHENAARSVFERVVITSRPLSYKSSHGINLFRSYAENCYMSFLSPLDCRLHIFLGFLSCTRDNDIEGLFIGAFA